MSLSIGAYIFEIRSEMSLIAELDLLRPLCKEKR